MKQTHKNALNKSLKKTTGRFKDIQKERGCNRNRERDRDK